MLKTGGIVNYISTNI